MIIQRYEVDLIQVEAQHIELIRYWRNSEKISKVMEFTDFITEEQQKKWYAALHPFQDLYFLIQYNGNYLGLIHANQLDWENQTAHSGLFIWDEKFLGTPIPVIASVNLLDTLFFLFSFTKIFAKVKHDNFVALTYNKFLGFEEIKDVKGDFINIQLEKENYLNHESFIKNYLGFEDHCIHVFEWQPLKNLLSENSKKMKLFHLK